MTIKQARRVLGKDAQRVSDSDLERDIAVAELFFNILVDSQTKKQNGIVSSTTKCHNMAQYGKK